ncbi:MAG: hypothetical protein RLZZ618_781 [Pseudomonadota bacterium]|jgi:hypothetical protein
MNTRSWWRGLVHAAAALLMVAAGSVHAGRSCEDKPPEARKLQRALQLAERVSRQLDDSGARVAVLARVGQNLSEYGQRYSHMGLAYRDDAGWRVAHKLNECGTAHAAVYRQGLGEFFMDDPYDYEAGIVLLTADVQDELLPVLQDNRRLGQMNTEAYSMVAYAWSQRYQQSNQWALETLAMAMSPSVHTRAQSQDWLRAHGYQPSTLRLSAAKRLGARLTAANVAFDDHPFDKRFSDRIETITVGSVMQWLQRSGLGQRPLVVR